MKNKILNRPIKICFLSYRSNPYSGGQGIYVKNLTRAIKDLGHDIEVISGPPKLTLDRDIIIRRLPSLDLYNSENLFRTPKLKELFNYINMIEWIGVSTMGFPEPLTFGKRSYIYLKNKLKQYDIIHDNQGLSYSLSSLNKKIPIISTVHHPITKDMKIVIENVISLKEKIKYRRWYSFVKMQKRVIRKLPKIITVSKHSKKDINIDFNVPLKNISVIYNGVNTELFKPVSNIKRIKNRILIANSSNAKIKGIVYLLKSVKYLNKKRPIKLVIVGVLDPKSYLANLIKQLEIKHIIKFTNHISDRKLVIQYAKASVVVIPSLYEGFGLPAIEAMACGTPVIGTSGGALPEILGNSGLIVSMKNHIALSKAIITILDNPSLATYMGKTGILRVKNNFSWSKAAEKTIDLYKEVILDYY